MLRSPIFRVLNWALEIELPSFVLHPWFIPQKQLFSFNPITCGNSYQVVSFTNSFVSLKLIFRNWIYFSYNLQVFPGICIHKTQISLFMPSFCIFLWDVCGVSLSNSLRPSLGLKKLLGLLNPIRLVARKAFCS